jgi:hypothetical protein
MIDEPIRWSHAYGKPVVPSSWQMTVSLRRLAAPRATVQSYPWPTSRRRSATFIPPSFGEELLQVALGPLIGKPTSSGGSTRGRYTAQQPARLNTRRDRS